MKNGPYELVIVPPGYPGKRYRGRYCYEHHLVWWQNTNTLPGVDEQIHHRDGNKRHNDFTNLEVKKATVHSSYHGRKRGRLMVELCCPTCERIFERPKRNTHLQKRGGKLTFCSHKCEGGFAFATKKKAGQDLTAAAVKNVIREFRKIPE
jgi:hypothetical protein